MRIAFVALSLLALTPSTFAHSRPNTRSRHSARHAGLADRDHARVTEKAVRRGLGDDLGGLLGGDENTSSSKTASQTGSGDDGGSSTSNTPPPPGGHSAVQTSQGSSKGASSIVGSGSMSSSGMNSTSASNSTLPTSTSSSSASSISVPVTTITTDASGQTNVITLTLTTAPSATDVSAVNQAHRNDDNAISTGAIIGISVGVGAVVLALIACAIWRMKKRADDEDEAIRWPELNRHGDSSAHHALPARETGKHGFETSNALERSASNTSSVFSPQSTLAPPYSTAAPPMALNGSSFGATSSLEDYEYNEKTPSMPPPHSAPSTSPPGWEYEDDYTNMPPAVQMQNTPSNGVCGTTYDSASDENPHAGVGTVMADSQMSMAGVAPGAGRSHATYHHGRQ